MSEFYELKVKVNCWFLFFISVPVGNASTADLPHRTRHHPLLRVSPLVSLLRKLLFFPVGSGWPAWLTAASVLWKTGVSFVHPSRGSGDHWALVLFQGTVSPAASCPCPASQPRPFSCCQSSLSPPLSVPSHAAATPHPRIDLPMVNSSSLALHSSLHPLSLALTLTKR